MEPTMWLESWNFQYPRPSLPSEEERRAGGWINNCQCSQGCVDPIYPIEVVNWLWTVIFTKFWEFSFLPLNLPLTGFRKKWLLRKNGQKVEISNWNLLCPMEVKVLGSTLKPWDGGREKAEICCLTPRGVFLPFDSRLKLEWDCRRGGAGSNSD